MEDIQWLFFEDRAGATPRIPALLVWSCPVWLALVRKASKITPKNELGTISTVDLARDRADIRVFDIVSRFLYCGSVQMALHLYTDRPIVLI